MRAPRMLLLALPVTTVAVIAFALLVVGAPRPYVGARVYGGPTEGVARLSLRLALVERFVEVEQPAPVGEVAVEARLADGRRVSGRAVPDAAGVAHLTLDVGTRIRGPVELSVSGPGGLLARSSVSVSSGEWASSAREHGGWLPGRSSGARAVRVAPGRGAFAVPFADPLDIEVGGARAGVRVTLEADGAEVVTPPPPTDGSGRTRAVLAPRDHVVSVTVKVGDEVGGAGEWTGPLPVVVGALHARLDQGRLRVESAIERPFAHFALITETERVTGGSLALDPDQRGGSVGLLPLPPLPPGRVWAVVSAEPELDTRSTVGWPLHDASTSVAGEPLRARAVPDRLLADGLVLGHAAEAARRAKARGLAFGFTVLAGLLAAVLLVLEGRRSAGELERRLRESGAGAAQGRAPRASRWLTAAVAVLSVAMGFALVLLVAMYRMR